MTDKKVRLTIFGLGLVLGSVLGFGGGITAAGCPEITITQAVVDAYCDGRQAHRCPDPCPEVPACPSPCPDPCEAPGDDVGDCDPTIRVVPSSSEVPPTANTWGDEGVDWTWAPADPTLEVDWTVVAAPDLEQAIAAFAFRWKASQTWRPAIAASWVKGRTGSSSSSCIDGGWYSWTGRTCTETTVLPIADDWRVLVGVAGTFGK